MNDVVGSAGFEPTTFRPPDGCATRLRYDPNLIVFYNFFNFIYRCKNTI